ncbi:MAG: imidazolonepropionase [Woeseiaceae bacterium]|nr:imidazolonepropionase [Woeseiaceae bacterium]
MTDCDLLLTNARLATMVPNRDGYGLVEDGAIAVSGERIVAAGRAADLASVAADETRDLDGAWVTPGLIDCHTHLVFAGDRAAEFERRLSGESYATIAREGGGIMATVRATRAASRDALVAASRPRLDALLAEGVTTVEIKSGYGLATEAELRMLAAARALGETCDVDVRTTFLGAHAVPADLDGNADAYLDAVVDDMLPAAAAAGLVDAVDAYCEHIAFSPQQVARVFARAQELGLPVKLHADQLSDTGGAALAAGHRALSADHLEYTNARGVAAMADAGTVAVLLPGAYLTLRETQPPPIDALREAGVAIAVASDCNPGTSPVCSLLASMHLASALFRLTPAECLAGVTRNAARALGCDDRGRLETGRRADLLVWDFDHPAELCYWLGRHRPREKYVGGRLVPMR